MSDKEKMLFEWLNFSKDLKEREERANAGMAPDEKSNIKNVDARSKMRKQEDAILEIVKRLSLDPLALPPYKSGNNGSNVKEDIRKNALEVSDLFSKSSFENAWERMRKAGDLRDRE